jgi:hypothetical protein
MAFTPSATAQATAVLAGNNQAALSPPLTALLASIQATPPNLGPAAYLDAIVAMCGGQDAAWIDIAGTSPTIGAAFGTIATNSYTAPLTRSYEFSIALAGVANSAANYSMLFRLRVDGSATYSVNAGKIVGNDTVRHNASWVQRITLTAGAHTIDLQASVNTGSGTFDSTAGLTIYIR